MDRHNPPQSVASGPGCNLICPWLHTEVACDGCRASPISGYRYKSQVRQDFDLCSSCFRRESPAAQQHFIRIERCQASKPYQICYIECNDCGAAPIKGPRYQHKTQANIDLCEVCFKRATSSQKTLESDFGKIEEAKMRSKGKKYHPALHFDKKCDECHSHPIMGPCYTSVKNPNYDVCAYCHDQALMQRKFMDGDFLVSSYPRPSVTFHLNVIFCVDCGAFPICGPSYNNQRKENKNVCLLCYFHVKKEKKLYFTKVDPPRAVLDVSQASPPNVVPKSSSISQSASHSSPHKNSSFVPRTTLPHQYGQRSASFPQPRSATGPPLGYAPASATPYQQPYSHSTSLHPSRNSYPGSYPGHGFPQANHYQAAAPGAVPNNNRINVSSLTQQQQMTILYKYYGMQTAQRQQEIQAFMRRHQHASQEAQNQYLQQFLQKLANGSGGGGGGGGGGVDYSSLFGGNNDGGVDYSSLLGGNNGGGVDYSSLMGGNSGGGVDYSSLMGGNSGSGVDYSSLMGGNSGSGVDYSSPMGGNSGSGVDYSSLMGDNSGSGVDYSSLMGGNSGSGMDYSFLMGGNIGAGNVDFSILSGGGGGGVDPSMFGQGGIGGGVLNSLLGAFGALGFN